jgi:F-type H+-transporting ATPase subunit gamma
MATTREIKRRIISVQNTRKITKAMEMVSSVKMRKARAQILAAKPYADKLTYIASNLRGSVSATLSPLLKSGEEKKIRLVVVSADKGLCGGFNANVIKLAQKFISEHQAQEVTVTVLGKKAVDFMTRRKSVQVAAKHAGIFFHPNYAEVCAIGRTLLDSFLAREVDAIYVVYNAFRNAASARPTLEKLLPVPELPKDSSKHVDYIFEPPAEETVDLLLRKYFIYQIWRIAIESYAAEQAARISAMNAASKNAIEMIDRLTLFYNKARQASITKELLEIVSGADALK